MKIVNEKFTIFLAQSSSEISAKSKRGRPRVAPEVHLNKLKGKVSKKEKKTLNNNAASCKYRHKKAEEQAKLNKKLRLESERNQSLQNKNTKLQQEILQLQLLLKSDY